MMIVVGYTDTQAKEKLDNNNVTTTKYILKIVSWDMTPCSLVDSVTDDSQKCALSIFRREDGGSTFL
jgi:hypothetical protein